MRLLLLSNAKREGMGYLEHARATSETSSRATVREILFVPYAGVTKTHDQFVEQVRPVFGVAGHRRDRNPRGARIRTQPCAARRRSSSAGAAPGGCARAAPARDCCR